MAAVQPGAVHTDADILLMPPQSLDAEDSVIGACFLDPAAIPIAASLCAPSDFYQQGRALCFDAMLALVARGAHVDATTVTAEMSDRGTLVRAGGAAALRACIEAVPSAADVESYAKIVHNKALLRELAIAARAVSYEAFTTGDDPRAVYDRAQARLGRVWGLEAAHANPDAASARGAAPFELVRVDAIDIKEEPNWLVRGLIPANSVGMLFADPKVGKTWLASDAALAIASATKFLGRNVVESGPVIYAALEDAIPLWGGRIDSLALARGMERTGLPLYVLKLASLNFDPGSEDYERLVSTVVQVGAKLLVLDPFAMLHTADENVVREVMPVIQKIRHIQQRTGVTVMVLHHANKPNGGAPRRAAHRIRGSSALHGWLDFCFYADLVDERTKEFTFSVVAARAFKTPPPVNAIIREQRDEHGRIARWLDITKEESEEEAERAAGLAAAAAEDSMIAEAKRLEREITERLTAEPTKYRSVELLATKIKCRPAVVREALRRMEAAGAIAKVGGAYKCLSQASGVVS